MEDFFDPTFLDKATKLAKLQKLVMNVTPDNITNTCEAIVRMEFLKEAEMTAQVVNSAILAVTYRPTSLQILTKLTKLLHQHDPTITDSIIERCFQPISESFSEMFSKAIEFRYLRRCMDTGLIQAADVIGALKEFRRKYPTSICFYLAAFCWFAPEMDYDLYQWVWNIMNEQLIRKKCPQFFSEFFTSLPKLRVNDWEKLKERINLQYPRDTVPEAILADDMERLTELVAKEWKFDMNQKVLPTIYQPGLMVRDGAPLLHFAAYFGSVRCFRYLLMNGANVAIRDDQGRGVACYAVAGGNNEIVRLCQTFDCSFDGAVQTAAMFHRHKLFEWLCGTMDISPMQVDKNLGSALHQAAASFNVGAMLMMFDNGVDPNVCDSNNKTPLHYAVTTGRNDSAWLLMHHAKINPNQRDSNHTTPLQLAALQARPPLIKTLVDNPQTKVNKTLNNETALHILSEGEDTVESVKALLKSDGLDMNSSDKNGMKPLHRAAMVGRCATVALLVNRKGTHVNAVDKNGMTPLHIAVLRGHVGVVEELLKSPGIDVNATDNKDYTALHYALGSEFMDPRTPVRCRMMRLLLTHPKINLTARGVDGNTPIDVAEKNNLIEAVNMIIGQRS